MIPDGPQGPLGIPQISHPHLPPLYGPNDDYILQGCGDCITNSPTGPNVHKKRKVSGSPKSNLMNGNLVHIKQEPGGMSPEPSSNPPTGMIGNMEDDYGFDYSSGHDGPPSVYLDSSYQCIRFQPFQQTTWHSLCDCTLKEL